MQWQAWMALGSLIVALGAVASGRLAAHVALAAALAVVILSGAVEPLVAVQGFASLAMLTVALLYVVAAGLRRSGALAILARPLLKDGTGEIVALLRMCLPVAALSAVLNNTPVVAMLIPELRDWARRNGHHASRFLIPVSYAAILGGLGTIIGTSTNLVVNDLVAASGARPFDFLEIGRIGLPVAAVGITVVIVAGRWLLPRRRDVDAAFADPRSFTGEMVVDADGPVVGKRLVDVALPDGHRLAPVEIDRGGHRIPAPRGDHVLEAGDHLVVAGPAATLLAAHRCPGLTPAHEPAWAAGLDESGGRLLEVVLSERCPLIGEAVGDGSFRRLYNAAVIAVARHGERVATEGLAAWRLRAGDTLLLEAGADFLQRHRYHPDFHVVAGRGQVGNGHSRVRAWTAIAILAGMVTLAASGVLGMFQAALLAAAALVGGGFLPRSEARAALDHRVLLTIACALGLGAALASTGAASTLADALLALGGNDPTLQIALVYLATTIATELVTNTAAASLMVPIALATAGRLEVAHEPFVATVMVAASASFVTPLGYQTNLMVYGPGGYRFGDFPRIGVPVALAVAVTTVVLAPLLWPL